MSCFDIGVVPNGSTPQSCVSYGTDPQGLGTTGQCYVALSRVRDIKRMHLLQPLEASMINVDPVVQAFYANRKDNPPVTVVPVTATAKKPGKKSNRPTGDKTMRIPNELVPLMQTAIDRLYNNPASGSVDLTEIQKFIDEAGKLL